MPTTDKSLKSQNITWLWGVLVVDAAVLSLIAFPETFSGATIKDYAWLKAAIAVVSPVIVLLLTSIISSELKSILVYWRLSNTLPGYRAFSVYAVNDPRIDLDALRNNVGTFPEKAKDQNTTWYKLYKNVENDVTVSQAHLHYLLFRDLASISLLLAPISAVLLYIVGASLVSSGVALLILIAQYLANAVAARHNGISLVTNVLALHAIKQRPDAAS